MQNPEALDLESVSEKNENELKNKKTKPAILTIEISGCMLFNNNCVYLLVFPLNMITVRFPECTLRTFYLTVCSAYLPCHRAVST